MNKCIVTGGAGFIGSHLTDALIEDGCEVHVIDNLIGGKKENVNPKATFHEVDLRDFNKLGPIFKNTDYVFHLAAMPRVPVSIEDPITTHDHNVNATLNVMTAARDAKVKRVVYSASSSAYGNQKEMPLKENMAPEPLSPYGLQKYFGELKGQVFNRVYGLETVSLRYFNVYGSRASTEGAYALVIGKFLKQRAANEPMTVVPPGTQSRDFTHVRDVVRANILASKSDKVGKGEVLNIGGGNDKSVLQIAEMIGGPTEEAPARLEPLRTLADISKAKELIDWEPQVPFEEGIDELKKEFGLK